MFHYMIGSLLFGLGVLVGWFIAAMQRERRPQYDAHPPGTLYGVNPRPPRIPPPPKGGHLLPGFKAPAHEPPSRPPSRPPLTPEERRSYEDRIGLTGVRKW